jgi:hypothetical protein
MLSQTVKRTLAWCHYVAGIGAGISILLLAKFLAGNSRLPAAAAACATYLVCASIWAKLHYILVRNARGRIKQDPHPKSAGRPPNLS